VRRRLKRGVFRGIVDLQAAINRYLAETNADPKPFTWTADPDAIIEKVRRGKQALESIHSHDLIDEGRSSDEQAAGAATDFGSGALPRI
jgi:hypothetical protein